MKLFVLLFGLITPWRILTFGDFKGQPVGGISIAGRTDYVFTFSEDEEGERCWFSVTPKFNEDKSFIRLHEDWVLGHENGHWLICLQFYRIMERKLAKYQGCQIALKEKAESVYQDIFRGMRATQEKYDLETNHGQWALIQKEWEKKINNIN